MQPIIETGFPVKYSWNQLSPAGLSLKNSMSFRLMGQDWMCATDMIRGGTVVLQRDVVQFNYGWADYTSGNASGAWVFIR